MDATVSPDGKMAATVRDGGPVVIWSLNAGAPPRELARLVAESHWPRALAFSSDNRRLAVGLESGAVIVLNVATRLPVATLRAHDLPVYPHLVPCAGRHADDLQPGSPWPLAGGGN
jgi:WD40 repeat protein